MKTLADDKVETVFAMFKGEPGTWKSTEALTFPLPQYWFSFDKKMNALILPMKHWGIDATQVHYDDYKDWSSAEKKLAEFQLKCPYKTLIIDSVTSEGDCINMQTMNMKSGTTTASGQEKGGRIGGIKVNTIEDYKAENSAFGIQTAMLKDIQAFHKVNIILIAHVIGERKPEEQGITSHARVIITGGKAISGKLAAYCDEVYHFNAEKPLDATKRGDITVYTTHIGDDFARTALNLPMKITLGDKQLYSNWVKPAIDQLNQPK